MSYLSGVLLPPPRKIISPTGMICGLYPSFCPPKATNSLFSFASPKGLTCPTDKKSCRRGQDVDRKKRHSFIMFNKLKIRKSASPTVANDNIVGGGLKSNSFPFTRPSSTPVAAFSTSSVDPSSTVVFNSNALNNAANGNTNNSGGMATHAIVGPSYRDQPEVDYDLGATQLYTHVENKSWESAIDRANSHPVEVQTWISRREPDDINRIRWRLLPLHATCVFRAPLSLIEALIGMYPPAPGLVDDQGMLPLHLACRNGASRGVVMTLLNAHPKSINVKDKKGRTPLNLVENSNSQNKESVIEAMVAFRSCFDANTLPPAGMGIRTISPAIPATTMLASGGAVAPLLLTTGATLPAPLPLTSRTASRSGNAVALCEREVDYENRTILFRLVLKKDWDGVASRVHLFPDEACTWIVTKGFNGNLRFLPIHKACVLGPSASIIQSLIAAFPEGLARADQDGWLPLHCACFYGAPEATIDVIIRADTKAAQHKDDDGRLPLHYACLKGASEKVVSQLLGAHVKGALTKDNDGRMPLHHACSKAAADSVIECLVRLGPKAAQSKDANGRLPLHLACKKGVTKNALTMLLRVYARGAAAKDDQEKLPVHHACQSGNCSPAAVLALLDAHPESIHARTAFGLTPHDEACQPKQPQQPNSNAGGGAGAGDSNLNVSAIIEVLDRFKAEQDRLGVSTHTNDGGGGSMGIDAQLRVREVENRVLELTNRYDVLQEAVCDIASVATQLKSDLKLDTSPSGVALIKFCDMLMKLRNVGNTTNQQS